MSEYTDQAKAFGIERHRIEYAKAALTGLLASNHPNQIVAYEVDVQNAWYIADLMAAEELKRNPIKDPVQAEWNPNPIHLHERVINQDMAKVEEVVATAVSQGALDIDKSKLPPKLAALVEAGENIVPRGMCPTCGMPKTGPTCLECSITPAS